MSAVFVSPVFCCRERVTCACHESFRSNASSGYAGRTVKDVLSEPSGTVWAGMEDPASRFSYLGAANGL